MIYPFRIDEARKILAGESTYRLVTYNGDTATIVQVDDDGDFPVLCLVACANGSQKVQRYTEKGMVKPISRSKDDLFIYSDKRIDSDTVPYFRDGELCGDRQLIDENRNSVTILLRGIYRDDLVNGGSMENMLCLSDTENGKSAFVCDYDGMRDGNQILFLKKKD